MNNKSNIFEELNKMKGLIHAKAGTVISEQLLNSAGQPQTKQDGLAAYMNTVGAATPRQKNINFNYCSVKNGKIETAKSAFNGNTFDEYVSAYTITPEEIAAAKATCPNVVVPDVASPAGYKFGDDLSKALEIKKTDNTQKGGTNVVNTRFAKSATDLGVKSDKMDLQTLQSILAKLQDDGSQSTVTQSTSTTTQQTPDLTQLTTLLNQLNT